MTVPLTPSTSRDYSLGPHSVRADITPPSQECPVCLEELTPQDKAYSHMPIKPNGITSCAGRFHEACMTTALQTKMECPCCRASVSDRDRHLDALHLTHTRSMVKDARSTALAILGIWMRTHILIAKERGIAITCIMGLACILLRDIKFGLSAIDYTSAIAGTVVIACVATDALLTAKFSQGLPRATRKHIVFWTSHLVSTVSYMLKIGLTTPLKVTHLAIIGIELVSIQWILKLKRKMTTRAIEQMVNTPQSDGSLRHNIGYGMIAGAIAGLAAMCLFGCPPMLVTLLIGPSMATILHAVRGESEPRPDEHIITPAKPSA